VNYFAHAWIASRVRPEPRFVLGAMLPDLAGFLRIRLPAQRDPDVAAGMALHHATDAVFHALPGFRERNLAGIGALRAVGIARGSARAAAHVGIELILDAALAAGKPSGLAHFRKALAESGAVDCPTPAVARTVHQLIRRLSAFDPAEDLGAPGRITERVRRTLEPRPALALRQNDLPHLERWLRETEAALAPDAEHLAHHTLEAASLRTALECRNTESATAAGVLALGPE
jgi:hypothetical protein